MKHAVKTSANMGRHVILVNPLKLLSLVKLANLLKIVNLGIRNLI